MLEPAGPFPFDEPLSNLDAALRAELRVEVAALSLPATPGVALLYAPASLLEN
ncbi:hypothetical protein [Sorangium sp. So ce887]|uniref:hypothetical protein n=1 Tax=Sorangium sp. So ce887 TaxID=3133324 RepID=UPI003F5F83C1